MLGQLLLRPAASLAQAPHGGAETAYQKLVQEGGLVAGSARGVEHRLVGVVEFSQFGTAVCALENQEPLLEIASLQIDASREDVEAQHALINVHNIVKQ